MVTLVVCWIVLFFIFILIEGWLEAGGVIAILGFILAGALGYVIASSIGDSFPTKTTQLMQQPLQVLEVGESQNIQFYVQEDKSNTMYTYKVDGSLKSLSYSDGGIVFDKAQTPYVEYTKTEFDFPEGQGWRRIFGISETPSEAILIHIPQGSLYITE
jgi:hypothetical protein